MEDLCYIVLSAKDYTSSKIVTTQKWSLEDILQLY